MNTNKSFQDKFTSNLLAGCSGFYIQSGEEARVDQLLSEIAEKNSLRIIEWNLGYGQVDFKNKQPVKILLANEIDLASGLASINDNELNNILIVIKNSVLALENNHVAIARLKQLLNRIQRHHKGTVAVVLVAERLFIPLEIEAEITLLPLPLPTQTEIHDLLKKICIEREITIPENILLRVCSTCGGLSQTEIYQVLSIMTQQHTQFDDAAIKTILREKEQIIAKSGVLEMVQVNEELDDIGGLENLKLWLKKRAKIIDRLAEAEKFGVKAPKGVLIAGMPGCGKSLTAKVAANLFKLPLLRLDIGSLLGKYVGESEHNMRRALHMAEAVSPCILWVDELEKAFVGMGGNNASEVTSRLLGYFLTWMQEKTGSVFVIATANDISVLPPELMRKGRFDETFYVGFPNAQERKEILSIHLRKAKKTPEDFNMEELVTLCHDYSGADIQNAINEALENAFVDDTTLTQELLCQAIKSTLSLRETLKEQVGKYEDLFERRKLKSASSEQGLTVAQMIKMADDPNQVKREQVASATDCTDDLLEKLVQDAEFSVREAAYKNPRCPEHLLAIRMNIDKNDVNYDINLQELACLHANTPIDLLIRHIGEHKLDDNLYQKILETTKFPVQILNAKKNTINYNYVEDVQIEVLKALALNPYIPVDIQEKLLNYKKSSDVKWRLTRNRGISESTQLKLAIDENLEVRKTLTTSRFISESTQLKLAVDENLEVRKTLARSSFISELTQLKLAIDHNLEVRKALAGSSSISELTQLKLAEDEIAEIRESLAENFSICSATQLRLLNDVEQSVKLALAKNHTITELTQMKLLDEKDFDVRFAIVDSWCFERSLSKSVQIKIANDKEPEIRETLMQIFNLTEEVKLTLANDSELDIYSRVKLFNLSLTDVPESLILEMIDHGDAIIYLAHSAIKEKTDLSKEFQLNIVTRKNWFLDKSLIDGQCKLDPSAQEFLARNAHYDIREMLAAKPYLSEETRILLSNDSHPDVRRAITDNKHLL